MSNHELAEKRIIDMPDGSVFTTSDFADITVDTLMPLLKRLRARTTDVNS